MESFDTLKAFQKAVDTCQVTAQDGTKLSLFDGLNQSVKLVETVEQTGNKVILIGNGGSAAIASHQATDLWKNGGVRATAFNDASLLTCAANDFGYPEVFSKPVEMFADTGDVMVAISSSGKSPNILNAVEVAKKKGCKVIGFSGFGTDNPLRAQGDLNFFLDSFSYGIVETGHLLLIHSFIDEFIRIKKGRVATA